VQLSRLKATKKSVQEYSEIIFDYDCKRLPLIRKQSKMNYNREVTNNEKLQNHIDYEPKSRSEWSDFKSLMLNEIKLRLSAKSQSKQLNQSSVGLLRNKDGH
jgi:hypothetical protein